MFDEGVLLTRALVNDIAYGRGSAHTQAEAKERAAEEALKSFGLPDI